VRAGAPISVHATAGERLRARVDILASASQRMRVAIVSVNFVIESYTRSLRPQRLSSRHRNENVGTERCAAERCFRVDTQAVLSQSLLLLFLEQPHDQLEAAARFPFGCYASHMLEDCGSFSLLHHVS
jgi:hypothetical protein